MFNFSRMKIAVLGDCMLDVEERTVSRGFSDDSGRPVLRSRGGRFSPGGAANAAVAFSRLGCRVKLVGGWANDPHGARLSGCLGDEAVACLRVPDAETQVKRRIYAGDGPSLMRIDSGDGRPLEFDWTELLVSLRDSTAAVVVDHGKGFCLSDSFRMLLSALDSLGVPIYLDVTRAGLAVNYDNVHVCVLKTGDDSLVLGGDGFLKTNSVVVTGSRRVRWWSASRPDRTSLLKVSHVEACDPVGAGDQFMAALVACHRDTGNLDASVEIAAEAATLSVGNRGARPIEDEDMNSVLCSRYPDLRIFRSCGEFADQYGLTPLADDADGGGVFVNGCFDLLHIGHLRLLDRAAALARRLNCGLTVAVNSDASTAALKGPSRPVNTFATRAAMVARLPKVSEVIGFDTEEELLAIIRRVAPSHIVKGSEYADKPFVGRDIITTAVFVDRDGTSTTKLIGDIVARRS